MAYIKLTLDRPIVDGETLTFKAPCDGTAVNGIKVYYKNITDSAVTQTSKTFVFKDANGNTLTGLDNLFVSGAYVSVILALSTNSAYIQNSATNGYLDTKFNNHTHSASSITAGTFAGQVVSNDSAQAPETYLLRNSKLVATEETPTVNGQICWQYE